MRLLEVIADDLVGPVATLQAARRELVQLGALRLRDAAVRHVADEHVVERENVLARMHERTRREPGQMVLGSRRLFGRGEVAELGASEPATHDGRAP